MSLRCKLGYHAFEIVDISMTTVSSGSDDEKYTVCVLKEYKCKRCGARDFRQTWESESCRKFFEDNYPCNRH